MNLYDSFFISYISVQKKTWQKNFMKIHSHKNLEAIEKKARHSWIHRWLNYVEHWNYVRFLAWNKEQETVGYT